jgi:hypothetical protein
MSGLGLQVEGPVLLASSTCCPPSWYSCASYTDQRAAATAAAASAAAAAAAAAADLEEFDRSVEGRSSKDSEDSRAVPPCYKAQHAEGRKLQYLLHYSLTSSPSSTAAA